MQSKHDFRFPAAQLDRFTAWLTRQSIEWQPGPAATQAGQARVAIRVYTENGWREMFDDGTSDYPVSAYLVPIVRHYMRVR